MPELPEVLTIVNDLKKEILNKRIIGVNTFDGYKLSPSPDFFKENVVGHKIEEIKNIAKLITIKLTSQKYIAIHLNMTGLILYNHKDNFIKIEFKLENGTSFYFSDVRMFGFLQGWERTQLSLYKSKYGKAPIDDTLTAEEFIGKISKKKSPIKSVLLDQKIISGIGNIYANDALFMSGINPRAFAHKLKKEKLTELLYNLQIILNEGLEHRGSTMDRYRDIYGAKGTHQEHFRVYGKAGLACTKCNSKIRVDKISGRSTFYCNFCQPGTGDQLPI